MDLTVLEMEVRHRHDIANLLNQACEIEALKRRVVRWAVVAFVALCAAAVLLMVAVTK